MRKWKHGCRLKRVLINETGITLVELLASISLLTVVILLVGSMHIFGQRHFKNQTESANQANDLSYALSVMSRDLRKQPAESVSVSEEDGTVSVEGTQRYYVEGDHLIGNGQVLAKSVKLEVSKHENNIEVTLYSNEKTETSKKYTTTIYFRR